jgi:hypothetical protein
VPGGAGGDRRGLVRGAGGGAVAGGHAGLAERQEQLRPVVALRVLVQDRQGALVQAHGVLVG